MKSIKVLMVSVSLFIIKTFVTFIIDYYKIIDSSAKFFPRDPKDGGFWGYSEAYVALEFIYGIWIYIAVVAVFYFLTKSKFLNSWPKIFWSGLILVVVVYLVYSSYEEPVIINHTLRENSYRGLNMMFVKGFITYFIVGLCLPVFSRKLKLI
ncbi:MAG: hypothetical protein WBG71_16140 [Leeuwenhoekiella sp.]